MTTVQPINFSVPTTEIPYLVLPEAGSVFADRALRLGQLAHGHSMGDYLRFVADIAAAQHRAVALFASVSLPRSGAGQPPLDISIVQRDPLWHTALRQIVTDVAAKAPPQAAAHLQQWLEKTSAEGLEQAASAWLSGNLAQADLSTMPLVAAALQVYWTALTQKLGKIAATLQRGTHPADQCPVCSAPPVGGIVRAGANTQGLRYLGCSLCSTQWHHERIHCVHCGASKDVAYYGIEGGDGAVQAEACDACHVYTKLMHMEKNPAVEIIADDLASLSLDVLVSEAGYQRYGLNPFLIPAAA